ncbi:MAG: energy transducer TonB [Polaromonas sp.]|nr:energy transducer TonB [Polaromonas sp.]
MRWAGFQPAIRILWLLLFSVIAGCASPDEVVQPASPASSFPPAYPAISKRLGEQGRVVMRVRVLASGDAAEVQLVQSSGFPRLDASAMAAMKQFKFNPARTRSGRSVDSWATQPIQFILK